MTLDVTPRWYPSCEPAPPNPGRAKEAGMANKTSSDPPFLNRPDERPIPTVIRQAPIQGRSVPPILALTPAIGVQETPRECRGSV